MSSRNESTRSGTEFVPAIIRNAGEKATESYSRFLAGLISPHTMFVYRSASKAFFEWCEETGLALQQVRANHVETFFATNRSGWKQSTVSFYFGAVKRIFAHLQADQIVDRSPFQGFVAQTRASTEPPFESMDFLKQLLLDLDGYDEQSQLFRPGVVAMYPIVVGGMEEEKIVAFTGIPLEEVNLYLGRLKEFGILTEDGRIVLDSEDQDQAEFMLNLVLIIGCAAGVFERSDFSAEGEAPSTEPLYKQSRKTLED